MSDIAKDIPPIKVIFLHGNGGGSVMEGWFPFLQRLLEEKGIRVVARNFPDPVLARKQYWLPFLENELRADEHSILIGYSSGAVAAMRYAENHKLSGTILVGACYTDVGMEEEKQSGYYDDPWQWEKIRENQLWIAQFASTDDPFIPIEEARHIHTELHTEYYEMEHQEHFGYPTPKRDFPEVWTVLKEKLHL